MRHANLTPLAVTPKDKSDLLGAEGRAWPAAEAFDLGRWQSSPPLASACHAVVSAAHLFTASDESERSAGLALHALRRWLLRKALRFRLIPLSLSSLRSNLTKRERRGVASATSVKAYVNEKNPFTMLTYELMVSALTGFPVLCDGVIVM